MIHIIGGGWYGCHVAARLLSEGYNDITLYEMRSRLFDGASGANPARLHLGFHYPRSQSTRRLCQRDYRRFMDAYGDFTRGIPINIYAVANLDSYVDYANYVQVLRDEVQFVEIERPAEFGLANVEGAVLTGERHILVNKVRDHFTELLKDVVQYNSLPPKKIKGDDLVIDCTFCALDGTDIDRYEPCVTHVYEGDWDKSVTIMDGPFPSIYSHYEPDTVSLTSAKFTPLSKKCKTYDDASKIVNQLTGADLSAHKLASSNLMQKFYPAFGDYKHLDSLIAIRAMPRSGADSRIWKLDVKSSNRWIVRAGKIDAVFDLADLIMEKLSCFGSQVRTRPL